MVGLTHGHLGIHPKKRKRSFSAMTELVMIALKVMFVGDSQGMSKMR